MGAASAAVSVIGGISSLSQQSSAAKAQNKALDAQAKQQNLQAQLQYISIKNQDYSNQLTDQINSSVRTLSYAQSTANTDSQQQLNTLATNNALFDAQLEKASAVTTKNQSDLDTQQQVSQANQQAGATQVQANLQAYGANANDINSILSQLQQGGQAHTAIANLLDLASSSGGVNEALSLLSNSNDNSVTQAQGALNSSQSVRDARTGLISDVKVKTNAATNAAANSANIGAQINQTQSLANANKKTLDATTSKVVADAGYDSTRAANAATNNIGILSDSYSSTANKYLTQSNLTALDQGSALQNDIITAQKSSIKSPGFLDYVGVGVNAYNTSKRS